MLLRAILERDRHTVWEAADRRGALEVLETRAAPALGIFDLRLAEESGVELLREIRADSIFQKLPVFFCSAVPDREAVQEAVQLGASGFLAKPLDPARVRAEVAKALAQRWMHQHFDDNAEVRFRLRIERDKVADLAAHFFRDLAALVAKDLTSDEARAGAQRQLSNLRRTAEDLGVRLLHPALAEWAERGCRSEALPPLLRRVPAIARLYEAFNA